MTSNLPATTPDDRTSVEAVERPADVERPRQPISVAFLPLALIAFVILAFTIAAWTFLHAAL